MAKKQLSPAETAFFCEQLSSMLKAGMQLNDGLEILSLDIYEEYVKRFQRRWTGEIRSTAQWSRPEFFPSTR